MIGLARSRYLTLAVHPNGRGMGWVAVSGPFALFSWGTIATRRASKNEAYLERIAKLLDKLDPHTLILEAFDLHASVRGERIAELCEEIASMAAAKRITVHIYAFADVLHCLANHQRRSRDEIAEEVAKLFPELGHLLPRKRHQWTKERLRMNLFCAAALVITHHAVGIGPGELFSRDHAK